MNRREREVAELKEAIVAKCVEMHLDRWTQEGRVQLHTLLNLLVDAGYVVKEVGHG